MQVSLPRGRPFCRHVLLLGGEHGRGLADLEVAERGRGVLGLLRRAPHHPPPDVFVPGGELQLLQQTASVLTCEVRGDSEGARVKTHRLYKIINVLCYHRPTPEAV